MDNKAMFLLSYGLFVVTAKEGEKDNGCITNTVMQVTTTPNRISLTVNKDNYTHGMVERTKMFNVSILSEKADFDLFKHFGFQSGRDVDKFANFKDVKRSENGLYYVTKGTNAWICAKVVDMIDLGTHTMFVADVTDAETLDSTPSATYTYYHAHIKPSVAQETKKGWRCKICGYIYEGEDLPEDFICPICKHGAADFERIG